MKFKKTAIVSALAFSLILPTSAFAQSDSNEAILDSTSFNLESDTVQKELEQAEVDTKNAMNDLEVDQEELKQELADLKDENPEKYALVQEEIKSESAEFTTMGASSMGTVGDVLVTYDQAFKEWNHGHAAIVSYNKAYLIEAMRESGVRVYPNRWGNYKTKSKYYVKGAPMSAYEGAVSFANSQRTKPYSLTALKDQTKKYYCSLLVWKAWNRQGYDLDGNGGLIVTPADLAKSSKTVKY